MLELFVLMLTNASLSIASIFLQIVFGSGIILAALFGRSPESIGALGVGNMTIAGGYIPYISGFFDFVTQIAWAIFVLNITVVAFKYIAAPMSGNRTESLSKTLFRFMAVLILLSFRHQILWIIGGIVGAINEVFGSYVRVGGMSFDFSSDIQALQFTGLSDMIVVFGLYASIASACIAASLAFFERFLSLLVYIYMAPLAVVMYSGEKTDNIPGQWILGLLSQLAVIMLTYFLVINAAYAVNSTGNLATMFEGAESLETWSADSAHVLKIGRLLVAIGLFSLAASCDKILASFGLRAIPVGEMGKNVANGIKTAAGAVTAGIGAAFALTKAAGTAFSSYSDANNNSPATANSSLNNQKSLNGVAGVSPYKNNSQRLGAESLRKNSAPTLNSDGTISSNALGKDDMKKLAKSDIEASRGKTDGFISSMAQRAGEARSQGDRIKGMETEQNAMNSAAKEVNAAAAKGAGATVAAGTLMSAANLTSKDLGFTPKEGSDAALVETADGRKGWMISDGKGNAHILSASGQTVGGKSSWGSGETFGDPAGGKEAKAGFNSFTTDDGAASTKALDNGMILYGANPTFGSANGKDTASAGDEFFGNTTLSNIGANPRTTSGLTAPEGYSGKDYGVGSFGEPGRVQNASAAPTTVTDASSVNSANVSSGAGVSISASQSQNAAPESAKTGISTAPVNTENAAQPALSEGVTPSTNATPNAIPSSAVSSAVSAFDEYKPANADGSAGALNSEAVGNAISAYNASGTPIAESLEKAGATPEQIGAVGGAIAGEAGIQAYRASGGSINSDNLTDVENGYRNAIQDYHNNGTPLAKALEDNMGTNITPEQAKATAAAYENAYSSYFGSTPSAGNALDLDNAANSTPKYSVPEDYSFGISMPGDHSAVHPDAATLQAAKDHTAAYQSGMDLGDAPSISEPTAISGAAGASVNATETSLDAASGNTAATAPAGAGESITANTGALPAGGTNIEVPSGSQPSIGGSEIASMPMASETGAHSAPVEGVAPTGIAAGSAVVGTSAGVNLDTASGGSDVSHVGTVPVGAGEAVAHDSGAIPAGGSHIEMPSGSQAAVETVAPGAGTNLEAGYTHGNVELASMHTAPESGVQPTSIEGITPAGVAAGAAAVGAATEIGQAPSANLEAGYSHGGVELTSMQAAPESGVQPTSVEGAVPAGVAVGAAAIGSSAEMAPAPAASLEAGYTPAPQVETPSSAFVSSEGAVPAPTEGSAPVSGMSYDSPSASYESGGPVTADVSNRGAEMQQSVEVSSGHAQPIQPEVVDVSVDQEPVVVESSQRHETAEPVSLDDSSSYVEGNVTASAPVSKGGSEVVHTVTETDNSEDSGTYPDIDTFFADFPVSEGVPAEKVEGSSDRTDVSDSDDLLSYLDGFDDDVDPFEHPDDHSVIE